MDDAINILIQDVPTSGGMVPLRVGLTLFVVISVWMVWLLRGERERSGCVGVSMWAIVAMRVGMVGIFCWLLCQPGYLMLRSWQQGGRVLVVQDQSQAMGFDMQMRANGGGLASRVDLLEQLGEEPIAGRHSVPGRVGSLSLRLGLTLSPVMVYLSQIQEKMELEAVVLESDVRRIRGLLEPVRAAMGELSVETFADGLRRQGERMSSVSHRAMMAQRDRVLESVNRFLSDASLAASSAGVGQEIVRKLRQDAELLQIESMGLAARGRDLQESLDLAALQGDVSIVREHPLLATRGHLGRGIYQRMKAASAGELTLLSADAMGIDAMLAAAVREHGRVGLAGVVLVTDQFRPLSSIGAEAWRSLAAAGVPLTVLLVNERAIENPAEVVASAEAARWGGPVGLAGVPGGTGGAGGAGGAAAGMAIHAASPVHRRVAVYPAAWFDEVLPRASVGLELPLARQSLTRRYEYWAGTWPVFLILALATGEYVLRRRSGRPM